MLNRLKAEGDFSSTIESESVKHNLPRAVMPNFEKPTPSEEVLVKKQYFDEDLKFTVPVNLTDSKKAFLLVLNNLEDEQKLLVPFAPQANFSCIAPHPLENLESSILESMKTADDTGATGT